MAKQVRRTAAPATSADAGTKEYRIRPGVEWINGRKVGDAKTVVLTGVEASYDLGLDRIAPADQPEPSRWSRTVEADGGN